MLDHKGDQYISGEERKKSTFCFFKHTFDQIEAKKIASEQKIKRKIKINQIESECLFTARRECECECEQNECASVLLSVKIGGILDASFFKNFLKIDCDTNLEASTGTSCGCQPPHKKQRLSSHPLSSSPSSSATSSSSAIVSSIIAGNNIIKDVPNTRNSHFDSPSTSSGISGKMQEQSSQNSSSGKCIFY